jgi:hypothetical protein
MHGPRSAPLLASLVLALVLSPGAARADTMFQEGFESPTWSSGQILHVGESPPPNGWYNYSALALVSIDPSSSSAGSQAVKMQFAGNPAVYAPGVFDSFGIANYNAYTDYWMGGQVTRDTVSVDARLTGPGTSSDLFSANLYSNSGKMWLSADGRVYAGWSGQITADAALGVYHNLKIDTELLSDFSTLVSYYLDGVLLGRETNSYPLWGGGSLYLSGAFITASDLDLTAYTLNFDNISVSVTQASEPGSGGAAPEPASLALFGLGALALPLAAWRTRRRCGARHPL